MFEQKLFTYVTIFLGGAAMAWMVISLSGPGEPSAPNSTVSLPANDAQMTQLGGLLAVVDPNWIQETPSSSIRLAQFRLPSQDQKVEDAELAVFSGIGGTVDENLNRWFGQFKQPDGTDSESKARVKTFNVGGMNTTIADLTGTFTGGGMPMSRPVEKPEFRLLAAIVEGTREPYYFKLVGPRITVEYWAETFGRFIGTLRPDSR